MSHLLRALVVVAALVLVAGCSGDGDSAGGDGSSSVEAFPEAPHFDGPLAVTLLPALPIVDDGDCVPAQAAQRYCSADGDAYRVLGEARDATVLEVSTKPSADHTSWTAAIRFDPASRTAVGASRGAAAAIGGLVLVTVDDDVLMVVRPDEIKAATARFFGLEKPEAWAIPDHFPAV